MPRKTQKTAKTAANAKETVSTASVETENKEMETPEFIPFEPEKPVGGLDFGKGQSVSVIAPVKIGDTEIQTDKGVLPIEPATSNISVCQQLRPNGFTCLDELADVKAKPNEYSHDAKNAVLTFKNLCPFCKAENEKTAE